MLSKIKNIKNNFDEMSVRERAVIFACGLVSLYFILDFFLIQPVLVKKSSYELRVSQSKENIKSLDQQNGIIISAISNNDKVINKNNIKKLTDIKNGKDKEIEELSLHLLGSEKIDKNLSEIYKAAKKVKVNSFNFTGIVDVGGDLDIDESAENKLYKYTFSISFIGSYINALKYISEIEKTNKYILFEGFKLNVIEHPKSFFMLDAYFLIDNIKGLDVEVVHEGDR